jgi:hypothetical protein
VQPHSGLGGESFTRFIAEVYWESGTTLTMPLLLTPTFL